MGRRKIRIRISWSDLLLFLGAIPQLAVQWPAVRDRLDEVVHDDPVVAPYVDQLDDMLELYRDDGKLGWRDILQLFVGIGPLVALWPVVKDRLDEVLHDDPVVAPFVDVLSELVAAATE